MPYVEMFVDFFASPRHPKCVLYSLSLATYYKIMLDLCLLRQVQFLRYLLGSKLHRASGRPLPKGPINDSEKRGNLSPKKGSFSVSSEPEILISKTSEAANNIPETVTNETILEVTDPGLSEMPSTEKGLNEALKQLRLLGQKYADLEKKVSDLELIKIKYFSQTSSH